MPTDAIFYVAASLILLLNIIYFIWSYFSLGRLVKDWKQKAPDGNFLMEHLIHSRSSINLLYAMITTGTLVLGFLGYHQMKEIRKEITKDILDSAQVDLGRAKADVQEINSIFLDSKNKHTELTTVLAGAKSTGGKIEQFYEKARSNQRLYVIKDLPVSSKKFGFAYSELTTIDGLRVPSFNEPPVVSLYAYIDGGIAPMFANSKRDSIYMDALQPVLVNLWIYGK